MTENKCQHCEKPSPDAYLCLQCSTRLGEMLDKVPSLEEDLEVTRTCQDRIVGSSTGKSAEKPWPIRVGAMNLSIELTSLMTEWTGVLTDTHPVNFFPSMAVGHAFIGPMRPGWRRLPKGYSGSAGQRARWLRHHLQLLVAEKKVGELYQRLMELVGDPEDPHSPGEITVTVDRNPRSTAGPCPTVVGHDREGREITCNTNGKPTMLWALDNEEFVTCPKCNAGVDVRRNRMKALTDNDLVDERRLLKLLDAVDEHLPRPRLYAWLKSGRLQAAGYLHNGQVVPEPVHRGNLRLFSFSRVRALQSQHEVARAQRATAS